MSCEPWLTAAAQRLESVVDEGIFAIGAQLWVSHRGEVVCDVAVGHGVQDPMTTRTGHNHYCSGKPFMALTVAKLVDDGLLDPTAPLESLGLAEWAVPRFEATVLDVLDHQVGLGGMSGNEYRMTPVPARTAAAAERIAAATPRPEFGEVLGGLVLEEVVAACVPGEPVVSVIDRLVLEPVGLGAVALDHASAQPWLDDGLMSVGFGGLPRTAIPFLAEVVTNIKDIRPAFGVVCSTGDLGRLFEACRRSLDATDDAALPGATLATFLQRRHPPFEDVHAHRTVHLAGGFMVDAVANSMSRLASPNSFGHTGGTDNTVTFTDLDHELTISVHLNGMDPGPPAGRVTRLAVVDEVYRCLAER